MSWFTRNNSEKKKESFSLRLREMVFCALLASLMFSTQVFMEFAPNIHLTGMLTMVCTIVFRRKALYPIYLYVFLLGLRWGFSLSWIPYLYLWTVLWAVTMLIPKKMPKKLAAVVYPAVCCLHGLFFGVLYAPAQALLFGFTFQQTLTWIAAGFYYDLLHAIGNACAGLLILPLSELLIRLNKKA